MINVFLLTQDEPFFVPKVIRHILSAQGKEFNVIGATCLKPHRKNKSMKDWFDERVQIYRPYELLLVGAIYVYCKFFYPIFSLFSGKHFYSVKDSLKEFEVKTIDTNDVNDTEYIKNLQKLDIDVVLSVSPPQLFKEGLVGVPKKCSLNAHGTLLPRHRGVFGSWWTLYSGDNEGGATIHTMELKLDAGENVYQESFPLESGDTQYSIAFKTKGLLAKGSVAVLKKLVFSCIN